MAQGDEKNTLTVERRATIEAPAERIYASLIDFHDWRNWSPWEDLDPELERTYSGAEKGVGAGYAWKGNRKAGEGSMEIVDTTEPTGVVIDLEFLRPFKSHNAIRFQLEPAGDGSGTEVTWRMKSPRTFMSKVMGIFMNMDKVIGKDFEKGLTQLDAHVTAG